MKLICIGRNYVKHIEELGNEIPTNPVIFIKPASAIVTNDVIHFPQAIKSAHFEGELLLRICKNGHANSISEAASFYDAISVGVDFTDRMHQDFLKNKGLPWETAKAFDNSAIIGKWIDKETIDMDQLHFSLNINNEVKQYGDPKLMMYNFNTIVYEISKYFKLEIGDVIFTGTPEGVGEVASGDIITGYLNDQLVFTNTIG